MKKFIFIIILFSSCTKEFAFQKEFEKKINIAGFLKANDTIHILVSYTLDNNSCEIADDKYIKDAVIYLYEDDLFVEQLVYDTINDINYNNKGYYKSQKTTCKENKNYSLKVFVKGFDTLYAKTYCPAILCIDSTHTKIKRDSNINGYFFRINSKIFFKDIYKEKNFFNFNNRGVFTCYDPVIETKKTDGFYFSMYPNTIDENKCIFSDSLFKNSTYYLDINQDITEGYMNLVINSAKKFCVPISLEVISYDAFMYYKTLFWYRKTVFNPLTELVQIYSNIKNGTGIFAGYSSYSDTITITKEMLQLKKTN
mgnify:CR=1 FL=1